MRELKLPILHHRSIFTAHSDIQADGGQLFVRLQRKDIMQFFFYSASRDILDLNGAYVVHELALNHLHAVTKHFLNSCSFL